MNPFLSIFTWWQFPVVSWSPWPCTRSWLRTSTTSDVDWWGNQMADVCSACTCSAAARSSRRFLYSSRGPLDVKRLKAGSWGRQMDGAKTQVQRLNLSLNWITQKMTASSLFEQITSFLFPQSAKMKWGDPVTSTATQQTQRDGTDKRSFISLWRRSG